MTTTNYSVKASSILDELKACGVTDVVTVPDYVQASVHMALEAGYLPNVRIINCATEDEAVALALASERVQAHMHGEEPRKVIARLPGVVSLVV